VACQPQIHGHQAQIEFKSGITAKSLEGLDIFFHITKCSLKAGDLSLTFICRFLQSKVVNKVSALNPHGGFSAGRSDQADQ
jgi:hypothetical protein